MVVFVFCVSLSPITSGDGMALFVCVCYDPGVCLSPSFPHGSQEIPLSEILQVEQSSDFSSLAQSSNPHCFEIITSTMVYYVGENHGVHYDSPALAASGMGMEVAQGWEKAIRQALMPVTPQPSVGTGPGQGKDHSE